MTIKSIKRRKVKICGKTLRGVTKFINIYEGETSIKLHLNGRSPKLPLVIPSISVNYILNPFFNKFITIVTVTSFGL